MFDGNDLSQWLIYHELKGGLIKKKLTELGVESVEDLELVFTDKDLLHTVELCLAPVPFRKFLKAPSTTLLLSTIVVASTPEKDDWEMLSESMSQIMVEIKDIEDDVGSYGEEKDEVVSKAVDELSKALQETKLRKGLIDALDLELRDLATFDVAFLLDCTGSMAGYISNAKEKVTTFCDSVKGLYPSLSVRVAFVGYRDHGDRSGRVTKLDFSTDIASFKEFVGAQVAYGGADGPEDVLGGLEVVCGLKWESANRVLFHIADSPCHGLSVNGLTGGDDYPDGDPCGLEPASLLRSLADKNVEYFFGEIARHSTATMVHNFNKLMGGGGAGKSNDGFIKTTSIVSSTTMMDTITKSVSASLSASLSASRSFQKVQKIAPRIIDAVKPSDWGAIVRERALVFPVNLPKSIYDITQTTSSQTFHTFQYVAVEPLADIIQVRLAPNAFAIGANRAAHYTMLDDDIAPPHMAAHTLVVVKQSMAVDASNRTRDTYEQALSTHLTASYLANEFNLLCKHSTSTIRFCEASMLQLLDMEGAPFAIVEELVDHVWEKFNNNSGLCLPSPTPHHNTCHEVVQAFSHWSYAATGGLLMVVDCQGSFDPSPRTFHLTDPAIHCKTLTRFGGTNLGQTGFTRFFKTHKCGKTCADLGIDGDSLIV